MAAMDKIYVTKSQFILIEKWISLMEEAGLLPNYVQFNSYGISLGSFVDEKDTAPVFNLGVKGDMWLLGVCPFDFVKEELLLNYDLGG